MTTIDYSGLSVLVTGASRGIGAQIALQLAQKGAMPYLVARNKTDLNATSRMILELTGYEPKFFSGDVSKSAQMKNAVRSMLTAQGRIDGLIHNAGFARPDYFENLPLEIFEKHVNVDYLGAVIVIQAALPYLREGSFISVTSSVVGYLGVFGYTAYAGPKFALIGFAESLRQELQPKGISVSVLCPPDTDTPGYSEENETKPFETKALSEGAKLMKPSDVAGVFLTKLQKRKFLILCNFESKLFYRLNGLFPGIVRRIMSRMVAKAQKKS